jgi:hypothetical protein
VPGFNGAPAHMHTITPATDAQVAALAARTALLHKQHRIAAEHRAATAHARLEARERAAWETYRTARAKAAKTRNACTLQAVIDAGDRWQRLNDELHWNLDAHDRHMAKVAKAGRL